MASNFFNARSSEILSLSKELGKQTINRLFKLVYVKTIFTPILVDPRFQKNFQRGAEHFRTFLTNAGDEQQVTTETEFHQKLGTKCKILIRQGNGRPRSTEKDEVLNTEILSTTRRNSQRTNGTPNDFTWLQLMTIG